MVFVVFMERNTGTVVAETSLCETGEEHDEEKLYKSKLLVDVVVVVAVIVLVNFGCLLLLKSGDDFRGVLGKRIMLLRLIDLRTSDLMVFVGFVDSRGVLRSSKTLSRHVSRSIEFENRSISSSAVFKSAEAAESLLFADGDMLLNRLPNGANRLVKSLLLFLVVVVMVMLFVVVVGVVVEAFELRLK
jgi:hypothetical protein